MSDEKDILDFSEINADPLQYLASPGKRLANFFLDRVGLYLLLAGMIFFVDAVFMSSKSPNFESIGAVLFLISIPCYWIIPEYLFGKSFAKFMTKTKVVTKTGNKPNLQTIIIRTFCRFIPFEAFSFLGNKAIGWHDSLPGTLVVQSNYPEKGKNIYV